jgi:hypothetical protein
MNVFAMSNLFLNGFISFFGCIPDGMQIICSFHFYREVFLTGIKFPVIVLFVMHGAFKKGGFLQPPFSTKLK